MAVIAGSAFAGVTIASDCVEGDNGAAADGSVAAETGVSADVTERSQPTSANNTAHKTIAAIIFVLEIRMGFAFS
jgi:hypothetical protein